MLIVDPPPEGIGRWRWWIIGAGKDGKHCEIGDICELRLPGLPARLRCVDEERSMEGCLRRGQSALPGI